MDNVTELQTEINSLKKENRQLRDIIYRIRLREVSQCNLDYFLDRLVTDQKTINGILSDLKGI